MFLGDGLVKNIVETVAQRFAGSKDNKIMDFDLFLNPYVEELSQKYVSKSGIQIPWTAFKTAVKQALMVCSESYSNSSHLKNSDKSNDQLNRLDLPRFFGKPAIHGLLLDYILVNWTNPLRNMIKTQSGRALLKLYVDEAVIIFERSYLDSRENNGDCDLHCSIGRLWNRRSIQYFDARDPENPYVDHIYTMDYPVPHTSGDSRKGYHRIR